ncbi:MAG: PleD family two-component system response regulator [Candidatus Sumerlaeia bacterium]
MHILIAEDDPVSRAMLEHILQQWEHEVTAVEDGEKAWELIQGKQRPSMVILDWIMPGMYGDEICRRVRNKPELEGLYIIMVTQRTASDDIVKGLAAGADDYITKPFKTNELRERIRVGQRILKLQSELSNKVQDLQAALDTIKRLEGIIPICSYCKKIRDDQHYWQRLEQFLAHYSSAKFSHSVCPECYEKYVQPQIDEVEKAVAAQKDGNQIPEKSGSDASNKP